MIHYKKFSFTELQGKSPCSEKPSENSCNESNSSNTSLISHFINMDFCVIFKSVWGSTVSAMTRIYAAISGVQMLAQATELPPLQNIQTSSSTHPASKSSFLSGSKVASADSLTTHICLEPILKIRVAAPPLNPSPSMPHMGTTSLYLSHLPMYIPLKKSHLSGHIKEPFYTSLTPYMHTT